MSRFVLTPVADQDLNDIWDYIATDNVEAADRVLSAREKAFQRLADGPALEYLSLGAGNTGKAFDLETNRRQDETNRVPDTRLIVGDEVSVERCALPDCPQWVRRRCSSAPAFRPFLD